MPHELVAGVDYSVELQPVRFPSPMYLMIAVKFICLASIFNRSCLLKKASGRSK